MKDGKKFFAVFAREAASYFNAPIAYIFIVAFVALTAGVFMADFFVVGIADMRRFFALFPSILPVFIPALTMRLWAEEKKGNTFELLLTLPLNSRELVLGKFCASFFFYVLTLAGTLPIPLMLVAVGKPDLGPVVGGYIGAVCLGAFYLSVGIFISGLCRDQIVAFILALTASAFFFLAGMDFIASPLDGWLPGLGSFLQNNFGVTRHWEGFLKGVVDIKDVLYFLTMTVIFLGLNILSIEDRMKPKAKAVFAGAVGLALAIGMVFNMLLGDAALGRIDLTEAQLYRITGSTKEILRGLKTPVQVKVYISPVEKMPTVFKTLERAIRDQLEEIRISSSGNFVYQIIPTQVTVENTRKAAMTGGEDKLSRKGIQPFQVQNIERDGMGIKLVYAAVSISYKDKPEEVIPRVLPTTVRDLEYDLASKIYKLTMDTPPVVALVAPYTQKPVESNLLKVYEHLKHFPKDLRADNYSVVENALREANYDVRRIRLSATEPLPPRTRTLVVLAPERFSDRQLYEINRFVHAGGNVIVAAQRYFFKYRQDNLGVSFVPEVKFYNLEPVLDAYGVGLSKDFLLDERSTVLSIADANSVKKAASSVPVKTPIQILLDQDMMNRGDPITGRLPGLLYLWGSALELDEAKLQSHQLSAKTLLSSSKKSWLIPYHFYPLTKEDLQKEGVSYRPRLPLAVMVQGQFPDVYAGQDAPDWPVDNNPFTGPSPWSISAKETPMTPEEAAEAARPKPGNLLVIGSAKMFEDEVVKMGGALTFFTNAVDALTLGDKLIQIRSHQKVNRSIRVLGSGEKLWYRFLTIFLVPLIVVSLGMLRVFLRQKQKADYLRSLGKAS